MRRFAGLKASNYVFHDTDGDRNVIALFAGSRKLAFIEYDALDKLIDRLQALRQQNSHASSTNTERPERPPTHAHDPQR